MSELDNSFSWKRDFKNVNWPATLKYCLIRSFCAGIAWFVLGLILGAGGTSGQFMRGGIGLLVGFPLLYFSFLLPIGLITGWLSSLRVPFAGFVGLICSLMIIAGDPLVFILKKLQPKIVPVDNPGVINLKLIIFIVNEHLFITGRS